MKKYLIIPIILMMAVPGWAATVYIKDISGTVYYNSGVAACDEVTTATSGTISDASTAAGAGGSVYICGEMTQAASAITQAANQTWYFVDGGSVDFSANGANRLRINHTTTLVSPNLTCADAVTDGCIYVVSADGCTITNPTITSGSPAIYIAGSENATITGGTITHSGAITENKEVVFVKPTAAGGDSSGFSISGTTVIGGSVGIRVSGDVSIASTVDGATISNCTLTGQERYYISILGDVSNFTISGNTGTGHTGGDTNFGRGIEIYGVVDNYPDTGSVYGNTIKGVKNPSGVTNDGVAIGIDEYSNSVNVYGNWLEDNEGRAIEAYIATGSNIYSNICVNNGTTNSGALHSYSVIGVAPNSNTVNVYNNTIYGGDSTNGKGIFVHEDAVSVVVKNNIIDNLPYGLWCDDVGECDLTNSYNDITSATAYTNCSGGTGAITGNPLFVNTGNNDYRLTTNSPAAGQGTDLSLTYDYMNNAWKATPSMGAIEQYFTYIGAGF